LFSLPRISRLLLAVTGCLFITFASAQSFPTKPIRIIVPFPPGGSTDVGARILAVQLSEDFKQPVIVENRSGAGTTIAAAYVASSPADGYTLYLTGPITHASSQALYKKLTYDALASFAPVGHLTTSPFIILVHPSSKAKTLQDLLTDARKNPGKLTYASSGNGAAPHLAVELIAKATNTTFTHIPFRGSAPAMLALLSAQVDFTIADVAAMPQIREGKLRALALTTAQPSFLVPGVPSLSEAGLKGLNIPSGLALFAPAGTPTEVVNKINAAMNRALLKPEVKEKLELQGFDTAPGTPEDLAKAMTIEVQRYGKIIRDSGFSLD